MLAHKYSLNVFAKSSTAMQTQDFPRFLYVLHVCFLHAKVASVGGRYYENRSPQFRVLMLISRLCRHVFSSFGIFI